MRPGRRAFALVTAATAGALAVAASPSLGGTPTRAPRAHAACAPTHGYICEESGSLTMAPDSTGAQSTDVVPRKAQKEFSLIEPLDAKQLAAFDGLWDTVVTNTPELHLDMVKNTTVRRIITCAVFARTAGTAIGHAFNQPDEQEFEGTNAAAAILSLCINATVIGQKAAAAGHVVRTEPDAHAAATPPCSVASIAIPVQISRVGSQYKIQGTGVISKARRPPLTVTCKGTAQGIAVTVKRPRRASGSRSSSAAIQHRLLEHREHCGRAPDDVRVQVAKATRARAWLVSRRVNADTAPVSR